MIGRVLAAIPGGAVEIGKRTLLWMLSGFIVLSGYQLCKSEPFFEARELPMTFIDHAVPFVPWTVWIYGTVSISTFVGFLFVPDRTTSRRLLLGLSLSAALCWIGFALFPTRYPRELFPLPNVIDFSVAELADLRGADDPANCCPSMHVALAACLALTLREYSTRRWVKVLPFVWALAVSFCTLTTKQHYFVDVPAGALVGVVAYYTVRWASRGVPFWTRHDRPLCIERPEDRAVVAQLRRSVENHQWKLDDLPWPAQGQPPLPPLMVRLINHVIYIEEIAGLNFQLLRDASGDEDLRVLYGFFADEERRHADGLRRLLEIHGARFERPGLGNALILEQFDNLDPRSEADAILVCVSNPVFETFLDAGTIPFLRKHPALASPAFEELVKRVCKDEAAHLALNWILTRQAARQNRWWHLFNPSVYRGILAVPFMSLDVYAVANRLGYDFRTLLPAFGKLWRLHRRYPELGRYPMWWLFRVFVMCGALASTVVFALQKMRLLFIAVWTWFSRATDVLAWLIFGKDLLERRGLPVLPFFPSHAPGRIRLEYRELADDFFRLTRDFDLPRDAALERDMATFVGSFECIDRVVDDVADREERSELASAVVQLVSGEGTMPEHPRFTDELLHKAGDLRRVLERRHVSTFGAPFAAFFANADAMRRTTSPREYAALAVREGELAAEMALLVARDGTSPRFARFFGRLSEVANLVDKIVDAQRDHAKGELAFRPGVSVYFWLGAAFIARLPSLFFLYPRRLRLAFWGLQYLRPA